MNITSELVKTLRDKTQAGMMDCKDALRAADGDMEKAVEYLIKVRNLLTQEQLKNWCPEQEFPSFPRMMHGPGPMGPMHPKKPPFSEE